MNFEEYLQKQHMRENPTILDDELPDDFDRWYGELSVSEMEQHANEWAKNK